MTSMGHGGPLNINWNDLDTWKKRGTCVTRGSKQPLFGNGGIVGYRPDAGIEIDREIPIFTKDRPYIEQFLLANET